MLDKHQASSTHSFIYWSYEHFSSSVRGLEAKYHVETFAAVLISAAYLHGSMLFDPGRILPISQLAKASESSYKMLQDVYPVVDV